MPRSFGPVQLQLRGVRRWAPLLWLVTFAALLVRVYLASLWFRFGLAKIEAGWFTLNPVRGLLGVVAAGQTPMPIPGLAGVAEWLLAVRADAVLSVLLPLTELALAAAFLTGWYARRAALVGIAVNSSLILAGLASVGFDGRIIALQAMLVLSGRRAEALGVPGIRQLLRSLRHRVETLVEGSTGPETRRGTA